MAAPSNAACNSGRRTGRRRWVVIASANDQRDDTPLSGEFERGGQLLVPADIGPAKRLNNCCVDTRIKPSAPPQASARRNGAARIG
jgi:hypothetical protein